jgi:hypothetical protein
VIRTFEDVLGLPLSQAVAALKECGVFDPQFEPLIEWTCAPKGAREEGTARVVAVREEGRVLVAARFLDGMPRD